MAPARTSLLKQYEHTTEMVSRTITSEYLLPSNGRSNLAHEETNAGDIYPA